MTAVWSRWCWPILSGRTRHAALPIALVVGTVLLAVNQSPQLLRGDIGAAWVVRAAANYAIPYVVSSVGFLKGHEPAADRDSGSSHK